MKTLCWLLLLVGIAPAVWAAAKAYNALSYGPLPRRYFDFANEKMPRRSFLEILKGDTAGEESPYVHDTFGQVTEPFPMYPRLWAIALVVLGASSMIVGFAFIVHFGPSPK